MSEINYSKEKAVEFILDPNKADLVDWKVPASQLPSYVDDVVEVADALGDILYLAFGAVLEHGMQHIITDVFAEIHESNMSKLDAEGNPIFREDGKIMKGENYFKPNISQFLIED